VSVPSVEQHIQAARELIRQGRLPEAEALSLQLNRARPGVTATLLACEVEEARADFAKALQLVTTALARDSGHAALELKRAQILMALRRRAEAFAAAERAITVAEPAPQLLQTVASMYMQANDPGRAQALLYRALELAPGDPALLYGAALSHFFLNEPDKADALLVRVLEIAPGNGFAWHVRSQLATHTPDANHIAELRSVLARPGSRDVDRMLVSFALAKELEDVGDFAQSFDILLQANRIKRATLAYDVTSDVRAMQNVMTHYSAQVMHRGCAAATRLRVPSSSSACPARERRWSSASSAATHRSPPWARRWTSRRKWWRLPARRTRAWD
jgi:predicted Zn-dependent protease